MKQQVWKQQQRQQPPPQQQQQQPTAPPLVASGRSGRCPCAAASGPSRLPTKYPGRWPTPHIVGAAGGRPAPHHRCYIRQHEMLHLLTPRAVPSVHLVSRGLCAASGRYHLSKSTNRPRANFNKHGYSINNRIQEFLEIAFLAAMDLLVHLPRAAG